MVWNEVECSSQEDLKTLQSLRLKETVQRVYALTPFYKDKFNELNITPSDINSIDDISKLPFTKNRI